MTAKPDEHVLIALEQAAKETGVTQQIVRELIDEGKLKIVHIENIERISRPDLEEIDQDE
jgi:hypothetical protein